MIIWHLLVECWMFQWFQMTLTCGVLNVSMVSVVSISTIIPCTMIIWHLVVECWMFQWFQRSPYQQQFLDMTLTCGVLNVSMVSAVSISTIIPWYDTYLWSVECFNGFRWHLLVECWMFLWFQRSPYQQ